MIIRLILSLAFIGAVLFFAARVAKKRGLGQGNGLIEVVARQRMGRTSSVNVVRIGDVVLVVGATEEHITLLTEVDAESIETALQQRRPPLRLQAAGDDADAAGAAVPAARVSTGALAGSVFDRNGWGSLVDQIRERTVRRS
jgi:flagellar protein FliO/FliZ